jgi:hypothetical protein
LSQPPPYPHQLEGNSRCLDSGLVFILLIDVLTSSTRLRPCPITLAACAKHVSRSTELLMSRFQRRLLLAVCCWCCIFSMTLRRHPCACLPNDSQLLPRVRP